MVYFALRRQNFAIVALLLLSTVQARLLLISFDGFRPDYLGNAQTPNFDQFVSEGVEAEYVVPAFITKTMPCHHTIITGLHPESHGIVGNTMYDPVLDDTFWFTTKDTEWWDNGGEPLWVTAKKQGLTTAAHFWPGGETATNGGYKPDISPPYNGSEPFRQRFDTVVEWIAERDIDFTCVYITEPDAVGHAYGPDSQEVREETEEVDDILGYLIGNLKQRKVYDTTDIIVMTDHGMVEVSRDRKIDLYDYVDPNDVERITETGAIMSILPAEDKTMKVYESLKGKHPNMSVYRKDEIPGRYHYANHRRIMPILVVCDEGWEILANFSAQSESRMDLAATHGYDNSLASMRSFFVARGPSFRTSYKAEPFDMVDVYSLMCHLLRLEPAPNNGSFANVKDILIDFTSFSPSSRSSFFASGLTSTISILILNLLA
ncbi:bis(5'-adenosyl)-triphosphatase enpp4-like [Ptychodera flava]|uniref:bis(5'-adenosyl)-triphosphatase enpp4-like n=1 Tax=Ptychodera flava TaxID=63121 RepID=UPI00396AAB6D